MINVERPLLVWNAAEFTAPGGTLERVATHTAGDDPGCRPPMLPDGRPALLFEPLDLLAASCDQILALGVREVADVVRQGPAGRCRAG